MQFLETIDGKNGEELTSAVLKFLLVNSATMRDRFVRHLRHQLPASKTPTFRDGIICQCEAGTSDDGEAGRIDLLIRENRGMVLGLENKFWANFTENQPKKYWGDLVSLAENVEANCRLLLLVPRLRASEIAEHLREQEVQSKCAILYWEDIQEDLREVARRDRTEVAAAAIFLDEYVGRQVLDTVIDILPHQIVGSQVEIPNDFHYDFLYKLKTCLPNPERIRPAKSWIGFYFSVAPSDSTNRPRQWFGFYRDGSTSEVAMGIDTGMAHYTSELPPGARFTDGFVTSVFVEIAYDGTISTTQDWKKRLVLVVDPLTKAVQSYFASPTASRIPTDE